ncbi:MAG TPA: metal ABC transporter substrate-binding protein [Actinomycetota bacterium]|nr:metal ABC transporter substrate-binding protein [Actinomycetota bacterium]
MAPLRSTAALLALALCATGCNSQRTGPPGPVSVVASMFPLAELARGVRPPGRAVRVTDLTPSGAEPHDLELNSRQVDLLTDADVVVYVSGLQPAVDEVVRKRTARKDRGVVDVRRGSTDPHVWLDPVHMRKAAGLVESAIRAARSDAPHASAFTDEAPARFRSQLDALHEEFASGLSGCRQKLIVTAHESFGPLAALYGLRQESISGSGPEAEPDPRRLSELVDLIRAKGVRTVFTEPGSPDGAAATLAREAGVRTAVLDPLEVRPSDDATYFSVMRRNLGVLREALDCS